MKEHTWASMIVNSSLVSANSKFPQALSFAKCSLFTGKELRRLATVCCISDRSIAWCLLTEKGAVQPTKQHNNKLGGETRASTSWNSKLFKSLRNEMEVTDAVTALRCRDNKTTGPNSSLRDTPAIAELGYQLTTLMTWSIKELRPSTFQPTCCIFCVSVYSQIFVKFVYLPYSLNGEHNMGRAVA